MSVWHKFVFHPKWDALVISILSVFFVGMAVFFVKAQTTEFDLPEPCVQAGITNHEECMLFMDSAFSLESEPISSESIIIPDEFLEPISPDFPTECLEADITDPILCNDFLFAPHQEPTTSTEPEPVPDPTTSPEPTFDLPEPCVSAGITSHEECRLFMESLNTGTFVDPDIQTEPVQSTLRRLPPLGF